MVELRAVPGFFRIGCVLAQIIDADAHTGAIYSLRNPHRVGDCGSGHEAIGNAAADGRMLGESAQRAVFREIDEEGP
jgi:hypothetical protein